MIQKLAACDIDPEDFYEEFVLKRRPCIITGFLKQYENEFSIASSLAGIMEQVPAFAESQVLIEPKKMGSFGSGAEKTEMTLHEFLEKDSEDLYLTTQYKEDSENYDLHDLLPNPMYALRGLIPFRPDLLRKLIPQQINTWIGKSKHGSSSGLHHDFHDNLYILLQGRKRFVLFPPQDAPYLYVNGEIQMIHDNGLIGYSPFIRSDGAYLDDIDEADESETESNKSQVCTSDFQDSDSEIDWNGADSYEELLDNYEESENNSDSELQEPPSFSKIPVAFLHKFMEGRGFEGFDNVEKDETLSLDSFPLLEKSNPIVANLESGDVLYLPASWFHEVTSYSQNKNMSDKYSDMHMALNYWFHPPSAKRPDDSTYLDDYWQRVFERVISNHTNKKRKLSE